MDNNKLKIEWVYSYCWFCVHELVLVVRETFMLPLLLSLWLLVVMMVIIVVVCVFGGILNKVDIAVWWLLLFSPEKIRGTALLSASFL